MKMDKATYRKCLKSEVWGNKPFPVCFLRLTGASSKAIWMIRTMQYCAEGGRIKRLVSRWISGKLIKQYGMFVSPRCYIDIGLHLPHPNGIVIGKAVVIGKNATIFQQVTLGSARTGDYKLGKQPHVGDDVILFAGCKVLGEIFVADGTIVGANAVLTRSTQPGAVMGGIPARDLHAKQTEGEL